MAERKNIIITPLIMVLILVTTSPALAAKIIYVDDDAPPPGDGTSWETAFTYLQDALAEANSSPKPVEIRVAQGIYTPDRGDDITLGDRYATFQLINGVKLKGGYAGVGTPDPNAYDIKLYETILTGDLAGDDVAVNDPCDLRNEPTRAENSYNVVRTNETAMLDGFTVTGGNSNGPYPEYSSGGGMFSNYSSSNVSNCTFIGNNRSGIANFYNTLTLTNCIFNGNRHGVANHYESSSTLRNCTFIGNGLGMANHYDSSSTLSSCKFIGNGEGIESYGGTMKLTNCLFSGNRWTAFFDYHNSKPILRNCTFSGNKNVIGVDGNAIATLTNCILWGNERLQYNYDGELIINYSCIQGWTGDLDGIGNINDDPCFAEMGNWDINGTPEDANDDFWIDGDYQLLPDSPCIDAGDPYYIPYPDEMDLDGKPRVLDGDNDGVPVVDMGAYEYMPSIPAEVDIEPDTLNLTSKGKWITAYTWLPEGYDVADIEPNSVFLEDVIEPERLWLTEDSQIAIAKFSREQVQVILDVGDIELTIIGRLTDGTAFEGTDIIKVIDKAGKKSAK